MKPSEQKTLIIKIAIVLFLVILSIYFYQKYAGYDSIEYEMNLQVGDKLGINTDKTLDFGIARPGDTVNKQINIDHTFEEPALIKLKTNGEFSKIISYDKNDFLLDPKTKETVKITLIIPQEMSFGKYSDTLKITFKK